MDQTTGLSSTLKKSTGKPVELVPENPGAFSEPSEAVFNEEVVEPDGFRFGLGAVADFFPLGPAEAGPDGERPRGAARGDVYSPFRNFDPILVTLNMCVSLVPAYGRFRAQQRRVHVRPAQLQLLAQFFVPLLACLQPFLDDFDGLLPRPTPAVIESAGQFSSASANAHRVDEGLSVRALPRRFERGEVLFDDRGRFEGALGDDEACLT
jgi:hypothetical protein